ncbi:MAG: hypothetical protein ABSE56_02490 [Bryobacteraceae bacterium]|jgi:hypothetical protein
MGKILECIGGSAVAPGQTPQVNLTMFTGNSPTIRNAPLTADVRLIAAWTHNNVGGAFRIKSPRLHDNVEGIRLQALSLNPLPLWPLGVSQKLIPQDTLTLDISGSAVAGAIESGFLLIAYDDCPGVAARLASPADVLARLVNVLTVGVPCTPGITGGWSGGHALNSYTDLLKANTDYALLGYTVNTICGAVRFVGVDTGNVGVAGPGQNTVPELTASWFMRLSLLLNKPLIPILNSANRAGITVDVAQNQAGTAVGVTAVLGEIGSAPNATPLGT